MSRSRRAVRKCPLVLVPTREIPDIRKVNPTCPTGPRRVRAEWSGSGCWFPVRSGCVPRPFSSSGAPGVVRIVRHVWHRARALCGAKRDGLSGHGQGSRATRSRRGAAPAGVERHLLADVAAGLGAAQVAHQVDDPVRARRPRTRAATRSRRARTTTTVLARTSG